MNPDLAMDTADQKLLKSTGAGNLFMVFGEPDLELRTLSGGKLQVELRGLDVYDPTSGEIRSSSTDDIACWFIDSDYNEESFFDEPCKKLQRPQGRDRRGRLVHPLRDREHRSTAWSRTKGPEQVPLEGARMSANVMLSIWAEPRAFCRCSTLDGREAAVSLSHLSGRSAQ